MRIKDNTKLTSVKIITDLYKRFKEIALREEFTLQKLVNRSMDKYLSDEEYKKSIVEYDGLEASGSNF
ncbi:hypothetical protein HOE22_09855 [Candidatus Woesearchaeota archaeon]|jgi:hypothetical protein|nr:hypothetical protein [Candidatus Woesearchaeota archaeon]MBT4731281.1 hypothetical protein [Candidatus Woesearchaeota archaeon]MBT7558443.1 hypothetical protein [Candidatus Woesearchaeota archaeon]